MDFHELILNRQSTRKYLPDDVDRTLVTECIEAARLAPSACNSQPWHFIAVDDKDKIKEIGTAAASLGMNKFAAAASAMMINTTSQVLRRSLFFVFVPIVLIPPVERLGRGRCRELPLF